MELNVYFIGIAVTRHCIVCLISTVRIAQAGPRPTTFKEFYDSIHGCWKQDYWAANLSCI